MFLSSNYWGGIAVTEGWVEAPGDLLEVLKRSLFTVGKVCSPRDKQP